MINVKELIKSRNFILIFLKKKTFKQYFKSTC